MKVCDCLFCLLVLVTGKLLAQPYTARNISIQHGLPEYYVSGLVQDKAGFVWAATRDGLARYDGRNFKVFRHQPFTTRSLANNVIFDLGIVSDTALVIHLENGGFQLFNPITEQFTDLFTTQQLDQNHIKLVNVRWATHEKIIWSRYEKQIIGYDQTRNRFEVYPFPEIAISQKQYPGNSILFDAQQQRLYAPFPGQLVEFDTRSKSFRLWPHANIGWPGKIDTYYGTQLIRRANGEILIGSVQQLLLFNSKTHRFRSVSIPSSIHTQVGLIYEAADQNVYFTYGMTVYRLTPNDQLTPIWTASRIDYQNYFHALLVDRSGVLWIGTNGDGIYQIDLRALPIKTYPYRTNFAQDVLTSELKLSVPEWIKSNDYAYLLRLSGNAPYVSVGLSDSYELLRADFSSHTLRSILKLPRGNQLSGIDGGNALRVMADGTVWLYDSRRGLLKVDSAGKLLETYTCPINWVVTIQPMGQWIWLGSEESGLYAYDLKTRRIVRHLRYNPADSTSLPSNHVLCLAADTDSSSVLWVGTQEGLGRLDTRTMQFRNWTERNGLPSATINTLFMDRQSNIWFSTVKGINRLATRTYQIRHFSIADGLQDIEYRQNHGLQLADGRLAFGGATGVTIFDPMALKERPQAVPVVLTDLRIANKLVGPGQDGSPLLRPLNATSLLRLKPTQNFLSLEFAGLQFNKPTSLRYRYQLIGVDPNWVYSGNLNVANYTNIEPGEYVFRVNAADAAGNWSPLIKTIQIIIDPPWWKTWWVYTFYGLLLIGLIRAYITYRIRQTELRQGIVLQEQEAQLLKENAEWQTRFFTNITHEFRTPLTLIINPLERLLNNVGLPSRNSLQQQYGVMYRNARRLLRLINQLLDIAKLEAGQLSVVLVRGNLTTFVAELVDSFQLRAERKNIALTYKADNVPTHSEFDAQKLETIGYNLLANALKFTPEGGKILVSLLGEELNGKQVIKLQVVDSGIGISAEQIPYVFDRFYQGRNAEAGQGNGTGIGLFLVSEFTRLLGGNVTVSSQVGQGATFTVIFPLNNQTEIESTSDVLPSQPHPLSVDVVPEALPEQTNVADHEAPLVLVVEDNDELREFIAQELSEKYRVLKAENGQQGWQMCLQELPELVVSDVMMPLMDGFALVERIKTTPLTAHIAVILLTAKTMTDARIKGLSVGANDYLTKPFHAQELMLRITNLLRHQQQLRQYWQQRISHIETSKKPVLSQASDDPFLLKCYEVLDHELANSAFSVEQLADELAVSHRTLHRKLSTLTGATANELMRSYRLRKAAMLLQQGSTVSEAAEKTGFEGLSYFSKAFKAQFAISPSAYLAAQKHS